MHFIPVSNKIEVQTGKNWLTIQGPKGKLIKWKSPETFLYKKNDKLYFLNSTKKVIFYELLKNIRGLKSGFSIKLRLVGIGFKVLIEESQISLKLGWSHSVIYKLPHGISVIQPKSRLPIFIIQGIEYDKVTQVAAEIRKFKKPEPYKGKGFSYENEQIRRKEGKKNAI